MGIFCKDCKHHELHSSLDRDSYPVKEHMCLRPGMVSLVTGEPAIGVTCEYARSNAFYCGPTAANFQG